MLSLIKSGLFGVLPAPLGSSLQAVPSSLVWPGPWFSHLHNEGNNGTDLSGSLGGIRGVRLVKSLGHAWHVINLQTSLIY